jgi:hypothetical protein
MSVPSPQRNPTLGVVLANALDARLLDVHTALPAKVERYDAAKQLVDVKPLVKSYRLGEDAQPVAVALPVICNVPLVFPGAGGFRITFPVQVGDTVLLVFAEASIDTWLESHGGADVDPADVRRHNLSDAVAIPGLHTSGAPWTGASASSATIGKDGGPQVVFTSTEIQLGDGATEPIAKGSAMKTAIATLVTTIGTAVTAMAASATATGSTPVVGATLGTWLTTLAGAITAGVTAFNVSAQAALSLTSKVK